MTTSAAPTTDPEDRRKHLEFIQTTIARMASASSRTKSWLLPVVTAAYGFALTQRSGLIATLGIVAVITFAYLDAQYLRNERQFRQLYNAVAQGETTLPPFSLNPEDLKPAGSIHNSPREKKAINRWWPGMHIMLSWSIAVFYGVQFLLGICVLWRTLTL